MTPHTQTILVGDEHGRLGNCFQYAVASLLDLHPDKVPHFAEFSDEHWWLAFRLWLDGRGLHVETWTEDPGVLCIATGMSDRGVRHSVLWHRGLVHDPHPTRAGLATDPDEFEVIEPDRVEVITYLPATEKSSR